MVFVSTQVNEINRGLVQLSYKDGKHAPITAEDQARFIAYILENLLTHQGKI
jgi:hypothetical protein